MQSGKETTQEILFDLLNGFMQTQIPYFSNREFVCEQWETFRNLMTMKPLDYPQIYAFISRVQQLQSMSQHSNSTNAPSSSATANPTTTHQNNHAPPHVAVPRSSSCSVSSPKTIHLNPSPISLECGGIGTANLNLISALNNGSTPVINNYNNHQQISNSVNPNNSNYQPAIIKRNQMVRSNSNSHASIGTGLLNSKNGFSSGLLTPGHHANGATVGLMSGATTNNNTNNNNSNYYNLNNTQNNSNNSTFNNTDRTFDDPQFSKGGPSEIQDGLSGVGGKTTGGSVFDENQKLYTINKFIDFLRIHNINGMNIPKLSQNTVYGNSMAVELSNNYASSTLLKQVAINHFKVLIAQALTQGPTRYRYSIFELFHLVSNKTLKLSMIQSQILYSPQQIYNCFVQNTSTIISMLLKYSSLTPISSSASNAAKVTKVFLNLIWQDPLYLDVITMLTQDLMIEFVETCDSQTLASLSSGFALSSDQDRRARVIQSIKPVWKGEIKSEWLYILALSLNRQIEIHNIINNSKIELTIYSRMSKSHSRNSSSGEEKVQLQKISIISYFDVHTKLVTYCGLIPATQYELFDVSFGSVNREIQEFQSTYSPDNILQQVVSMIGVPPTQTPLGFNNNGSAFHNNSNSTNVMGDSGLGKNSRFQLIQSNFGANSPRVLGGLLFGNNNNNNSVIDTGSGFPQPIHQSVSSNQTTRGNSTHHGSMLSQQQLQQQQLPLGGGLGNKFSHFENATSPKYAFSGVTMQRSTSNAIKVPQNLNPQDEWNKVMLISKTKELLFTLNIDSDKLNALAQLTSLPIHQKDSKENVQPRSSPSQIKNVTSYQPSSLNGNRNFTSNQIQGFNHNSNLNIANPSALGGMGVNIYENRTRYEKSVDNRDIPCSQLSPRRNLMTQY